MCGGGGGLGGGGSGGNHVKDPANGYHSATCMKVNLSLQRADRLILLCF